MLAADPPSLLASSVWPCGRVPAAVFAVANSTLNNKQTQTTNLSNLHLVLCRDQQSFLVQHLHCLTTQGPSPFTTRKNTHAAIHTALLLISAVHSVEQVLYSERGAARSLFTATIQSQTVDVVDTTSDSSPSENLFESVTLHSLIHIPENSRLESRVDTRTLMREVSWEQKIPSYLLLFTPSQ